MRHLQAGNLQLRSSDDGTAVIEGRAVPYGQTIEVGGVRETFTRGAVDPAQLTGSPVLWQHDRAEVIGVIDTAEDREDGAYFTATLIPTARGRDAITALRAGAVTGLSIGFEPVADQWDGDTVTRTAVRVREVSVATLPAYEDAQVLTVRNHDERKPPVENHSPAETTAPAVDLSAYATRDDMIALESRIMAGGTAAAGPVLSVRDAFVAQLIDARDRRQLRNLADALSSGNAGVLPPAWSSEVRASVDRQRYCFNALGSIGFPSTGYTLTIPKITQQTQVAARGTEMTAIPTRALTTGSDTYTAKWFAGGIEVALELVYQSDPAIYPIIVDSIIGQYAVATDTALTTDLVAAAGVAGSTLDTTSYGAFIVDAFTTAEAIRAATGDWGDMLQVTTATWQKIVGMLDGEGRRALAPVGPVNADGSAPVLSRAVNIGGLQVIHNPRISADVQYNKKSARVGEKAPVTLTGDVVALMGRELGVLGGYIFVPAYPAGIVKHTATVVAAEEEAAPAKK